jgi:hypothetical protein
MKRFTFPAILMLAIVAVGRADQIVLVAGDARKKDGAPAVEFRLGSPFGVDSDCGGNRFPDLKSATV